MVDIAGYRELRLKSEQAGIKVAKRSDDDTDRNRQFHRLMHAFLCASIFTKRSPDRAFALAFSFQS